MFMSESTILVRNMHQTSSDKRQNSDSYFVTIAINFYDAFHLIFFSKMIITRRKTVSKNQFR